MRRSVALPFLLALALPSAGWADHHLMRVTEVAPTGGQADQFIELRDPVPEPFPPTRQYSVAARDAGGAVLASQVLTEPFEFRNNTAPSVLGGANVMPRDRELTFAIPAAAVEVCFYGGANPVDCLAYGDVTVPPGQSAQRQSCGVVAAPPSPDAPNGETGCGDGGGGTGGGGGGGGGTGGGDAEDLTRPQQKVSGKRRQDVDRLAVAVTLNEAGRVRVRGRVNVPDASRLFRFRPVSRAAGANERVRLRLRLPRRARRAVKAAIADGRRLRARITITARDEAGNPSTARKAIRLTD
jgi:hypothetical protein